MQHVQVHIVCNVPQYESHHIHTCTCTHTCKHTHMNTHIHSRSSTGVGEFFFKSERSVEITHAIETVVGAMAKDKKSTKPSKVGIHVHVNTDMNRVKDL